MKIHIQEKKVKKQAQINEPVFLFPYDKLILFVRAILHAVSSTHLKILNSAFGTSTVCFVSESFLITRSFAVNSLSKKNLHV